MKKVLVIFVCIMSVFTSAGQTDEKYFNTMEPLVSAMDTTQDRNELITLANAFERIANVDKTRWMPFYYAALAYINAGYTFGLDGSFGDKSADMDPYADKAEQLVNQADGLSKDNSEIWTLKKMLATLRMMANPMARYQQYASIAATALETAKKLDPENPRVYILEGRDLFYTPEQFGGDKQEAKKRFETALEKFQTVKPASSIHPNWGRGQTNYFLSQIK